MSKKSRRARRAPNTPQPVHIRKPGRPLTTQPPKEVNFAEEYHYVVEDLKRIAIIAALLLVLLIVLALVIG
jgi:hypothetical protein